jgi:hypothetical protein
MSRRCTEHATSSASADVMAITPWWIWLGYFMRRYGSALEGPSLCPEVPTCWGWLNPSACQPPVGPPACASASGTGAGLAITRKLARMNGPLELHPNRPFCDGRHIN